MHTDQDVNANRADADDFLMRFIGLVELPADELDDAEDLSLLWILRCSRAA